MPLLLVTGPAIEPVSLAEQKTHMRVTGTTEDSLIAEKIIAAREVVEALSNRQFITATWKLTLPQFVTTLTGRQPSDNPIVYESGNAVINSTYVPENRGFSLFGSNSHWGTTMEGQTVLYLPRAPLQSLVGTGLGITYLNTSGVRTTLTMDYYEVHLGGPRTPGFIARAYNKSWPAIQAVREGCIEATYKAGYGAAAASVPGVAKQAIMILAAELYERREEVSQGQAFQVVPWGVRNLIDNTITVPQVA